MSEAIAQVSLPEFLEAEARSTRRHELVGGRVYVRPGGTERHGLAAGLLLERVAPGARDRGCRPFGGNRLVHTRLGSLYYPDVMVACGKAPHPMYETDPTLVIEVLSPSTADLDRREKAPAYAAAETLDLLLLVDPHYRRIEVAKPVKGELTWNVAIPGDVVITGYGDIDVAEFYVELEDVVTT